MNLAMFRHLAAALLVVFLLPAASQAADKAPVDFSLPDVHGQTRQLSEFRGKWVVLNYWATWCPPCREEMPDLGSFHEQHKDKDAVVVGINYEDVSDTRLLAFLEDYLVDYPILLAQDMTAPSPRLAVGGLPTTYIISPEGVPVARHVGPITADALEAYIERKKQEQ